jgi:hypothetical protein
LSASHPLRDPRIDFVRGLCLLVIFSAHLNPNYLKKFINGLGFSDSAEVFVFLSGYVAGLVFYRQLVRDGFRACLRGALKRCGEIYVAHLLTLVVTLTLVRLCFTDLTFSAIHADLFETDPGTALARVTLLAYFPDWFNILILPLFIPLLAVMPAMLWINARWGSYAMLGVSAALYALVQACPRVVHLPAPWREAWYFNPLAWQFLFFMGVAIGTSPRWRQTAVPRGRLWTAAAVLALGLILLLKCLYTAWQHPAFFEDLHAILFQGAEKQLPFIPYPAQFPLTGKPNLEPLRLVHFGVLIYLMMALIPRVWRFWDSRVATLLIACGRHSLPIFCCAVMLTYAANEELTFCGHSLLAQTAANVSGWCLLVAVAWGLDAFAWVLHRSGPCKRLPQPEPSGSKIIVRLP